MRGTESNPLSLGTDISEGDLSVSLRISAGGNTKDGGDCSLAGGDWGRRGESARGKSELGDSIPGKPAGGFGSSSVVDSS